MRTLVMNLVAPVSRLGFTGLVAATAVAAIASTATPVQACGKDGARVANDSAAAFREIATKPGMGQATYSVKSISCESCANKIRAALKSSAGVERVTVDVRAKTVTVAFQQATQNPESVREIITSKTKFSAILQN